MWYNCNKKGKLSMTTAACIGVVKKEVRYYGSK